MRSVRCPFTLEYRHVAGSSVGNGAANDAYDVRVYTPGRPAFAIDP